MSNSINQQLRLDNVLREHRNRIKILEAAVSTVAPGGGIDFNKKNDTDETGAAASYLYLRYTGSSPLPHTSPGGMGPAYGGATDYGGLAYMNQDTGVTGDGGQIIQNNGGGVIGLDQTGPGILAPWSLTTSRFDGPPSGGVSGPFVGDFVRSSGNGAIWLKQTGGPIIIDNSHDVILNNAQGHDINSVAHKTLLHGNDFLLADNQTITRNGSGVITAITYSNAWFRGNSGSVTITPGTGRTGIGLTEIISGIQFFQADGSEFQLSAGATNRILGAAEEFVIFFIGTDDSAGGGATGNMQLSSISGTSAFGVTVNGTIAITGSLTTVMPSPGSGVWWNNGGVVHIA